MNFLQLPVELGILILSYLDCASKIKLYCVVELRKFFAPCMMLKVNIARSSLASVKTLTLDVFQNFAVNIQELNLSGILDLTVDKLRQPLVRCPNLKTLDLTFTSIYLPDFCEMIKWKIFENLRNISINFFKWTGKRRSDTWSRCVDIFKRKHFGNVHFIVFKFFDSQSPLIFMSDMPRTKNLKITVADSYRSLWESDEDELKTDIMETDGHILDIQFEKLSYVSRDYRALEISPPKLGVFNFDFKQIEYIFIMYSDWARILIYVSPKFGSIFTQNCSHSTVEIHTYLPLDFLLDGNIVFKAWNVSFPEFNHTFFKNVLIELTDYFPTYICTHHKLLEMKTTEAPSNWFCIDSGNDLERSLENVPEKVTLTDFCSRDEIILRCNRPASLVSESKTLKNLTFLRLSNISMKEDFFTTLFSHCKNLYTLDVHIEKGNRRNRICFLSLSNSMHLTRSLKNIKLESTHIEYEVIFASLCQCRSLENIHICEYERMLADNEIDVQNILSVIEKCLDLYSLFIESNMFSVSRNFLMSALRATAQNLERDQLCIDVCGCFEGWNPFTDVFHPSPLHAD